MWKLGYNKFQKGNTHFSRYQLSIIGIIHRVWTSPWMKIQKNVSKIISCFVKTFPKNPCSFCQCLAVSKIGKYLGQKFNSKQKCKSLDPPTYEACGFRVSLVTYICRVQDVKKFWCSEHIKFLLSEEQLNMQTCN